MNPKPPAAPLTPSAVDPEVFRRVWNRVMPDQKDCPIIPAAPRPKAPPVRPPAAAPTPPDAAQLLRERMAQLRIGTLQAQHLARRYGSKPPLVRLMRERQQAMRKLSAACFLACGQRFQPSGQVPAPPTPLAAALREQFFWEQQWAQDCLLSSGDVGDPSLKELFQTLSHQSQARSRDIRTQLERM